MGSSYGKAGGQVGEIEGKLEVSKLLHVAAEKGEVNEVECLLKSKADVNYKDRCGESALHEASRHGQQSVVELLLNSNAYINLQEHTNGWTPLHVASWNGNAAVVVVLLARNADPAIKSKYGQTARDVAVQCTHDTVAKILEAWRGDRRATPCKD